MLFVAVGAAGLIIFLVCIVRARNLRAASTLTLGVLGWAASAAAAAALRVGSTLAKGLAQGVVLSSKRWSSKVLRFAALVFLSRSL